MLQPVSDANRWAWPGQLDRRYEGENARSLKQHSGEHLRSITKKDEGNALYKHVKA